MLLGCMFRRLGEWDVAIQNHICGRLPFDACSAFACNFISTDVVFGPVTASMRDSVTRDGATASKHKTDCCLLIWMCAVPATSVVNITCAATRGALPPFNATIQAAGTSGACNGTTRTTTVVRVPCCANGTAYAQGSSPRCLNVTALRCKDYISINTGVPTQVTTYAMFVDANKTCQGGVSPGSMYIACKNNPRAAASTIGFGNISLETTGTGGTNTSFFLGCNTDPSGVNGCTPAANFGAPACNFSSPASTCGGALTSRRTVVMKCECANVRWIVASVPVVPASSFFTYQPPSGSCTGVVQGR